MTTIADKLRGAGDFVSSKISKSGEWIAEKAALLGECQNVGEFCSTALRCCAEACVNVKNTVTEAVQGIKQGITDIARAFGRALAPVNETSAANPLTKALTASAAQYAARQEEKKQRIAFFRELRRKRAEETAESSHKEDHSITQCAPNSVDPASIADLKLAMLLNRIPTECTPEVRRFFEQMGDQAKRKDREIG